LSSRRRRARASAPATGCRCDWIRPGSTRSIQPRGRPSGRRRRWPTWKPAMTSQPGNSGPAATLRGAVAHAAPLLGAKGRNLGQVVARLDEAAAQGARLVVFPECALSGYLLDNLDEVARLAEPVPGPAIRRLAETCAGRHIYAVVGLLEKGAD